MKSVSVELSHALPRMDIYIGSDWHVGDRSCNMEKIHKLLNDVASDPTKFLILNGDLMNNATKTSVSDCYAEEIPPMKQLELLVSLLAPVKDKILFVSCGNHEARTYKNDGIDLMALLTKELGIADRYAREGGVLFVSFGESVKYHQRKVSYSIYVTHGSGGGRKEGAKAIRLADMSSIVDADIYIHSHTHLPFVMKENFFRVDSHKKFVTEVTHLFVNSSAQLEYGGYGQVYEFKPNSTDCPVIHLFSEHKKYTATL